MTVSYIYKELVKGGMSAEYVLNAVTFDEIELFFEAMAEKRDMWQERFGWVCHSIYNSTNLGNGGEPIDISKFMPNSWEPPKETSPQPTEPINPEQEKTRLKKLGENIAKILNSKK